MKTNGNKDKKQEKKRERERTIIHEKTEKDEKRKYRYK